jgi:hypothetical protein
VALDLFECAHAEEYLEYKESATWRRESFKRFGAYTGPWHPRRDGIIRCVPSTLSAGEKASAISQNRVMDRGWQKLLLRFSRVLQLKVI